MRDSISVLFLVVGRGGSKGLPGKNLKTIGGLSLVALKTLSAKGSTHCGRIVVSSDDREIRLEAERFGADVLFARPVELSSDTASSDDVVLHAMDWIESNEGRTYDAVMLLEPSSPFATADHYDQAVEVFVERNADLVVGVRPVEVSPVFVGPLGADQSISEIVSNMLGDRDNLRRQDRPLEVTMNGSFYLVRWDTLKRSRRIYSNPAGTYGVLMDRWHSVEIEDQFDLVVAQTVYDQRLINTDIWDQSD